VGKRGPAPTPTALKVLRGSRPSTINHQEPKPEIGAGDPPSWLGDEAIEYWREYAPKLENLGVLCETDRTAFALLAHTWGQWCEARLELAANESVQTSASGHSQVTPWVTIARQLQADYLRQASKFGMNPSDRTGITAVPRTSDIPDPLGLMK